MRRPVVRVRVFVFREAPAADFRAYGLGHARVVAHEPQQSEGVVLVGLHDCLALFPAGFRVGVVHAYHVRAEAAAVVHVRLAAGHDAPDEIVFEPGFLRLGGNQAGEKFVARGVIAGRLFDGDAVLQAVRQAGAEVVGLDEAVAGACSSQAGVAHAPEQAAFRPAGLHERIHSVRELMPLEHLHSVPRLAVFFVALAAYPVLHSRGGHQVAFVGAVDEPRGGEAQGVRAVRDPDAADSCAVHGGIHQVIVFDRLDAGVVQIAFEHLQRGAGFENPVFQIAVVCAQPAVELQGQALHHLFVAYVRLADPAGCERAEAAGRLDEHDIEPLLRR